MIKNIEINNQKDLNKFYKRLFIYRSFLYKKVTFTVEKDKYNITDIINALNIKKRKQRLEFIYDTCCKEIDDFYDHKDICHFKNNKCLVQEQLGNETLMVVVASVYFKVQKDAKLEILLVNCLLVLKFKKDALLLNLKI